MSSVNVLGKVYAILNRAEKDDDELVGLAGYTNFESKYIVLNADKEDEYIKNNVIRHELIYALLYECGLDTESWGRNEEIVDWIALQFPKMLKMFESLGIEK